MNLCMLRVAFKNYCNASAFGFDKAMERDLLGTFLFNVPLSLFYFILFYLAYSFVKQYVINTRESTIQLGIINNSEDSSRYLSLPFSSLPALSF
jgi:hypothetical protein